MIEVQVKNKEIFEKLKTFSVYSSELTGVMSFHDHLKPILMENGILFDEEVLEIQTTPKLDIVNGNVMKLIDAPFDMLLFVGCKTTFDTTIALNSMHEVNLLIKNDLVEMTERFKEAYSPLKYRNKINELISANVKFYGKGKVTDSIDGNLTIQSLEFNKFKDKNIVYKQINNLSVESSIDTSSSKTWTVILKSKDGKSFKLHFYQKPMILQSIFTKGNLVNVAAKKITYSRGFYTIYDPLIVPFGLEMYRDTIAMPPSRKIPAELWRNCYYEFECRNQLIK